MAGQGKINFCTLFDSTYLTRALAMYESLKRCCPSFHLYVFALDDLVKVYFSDCQFEDITVISEGDFQSPRLVEAKKHRNKAEYCWTCTPVALEYAIDQFQLDHCIYLDADLYFFGDPTSIAMKLEENSILITPHNYLPRYDYSADCGIYCVQFIGFKNDEYGRRALGWWRDACLDWCYARVEDGKFGDQKYLDDWPTRFQGVCVIKSSGMGVAPWNVSGFGGVGAISDFCFYHFHGIEFFQGGVVRLAFHYEIPDWAVRDIYCVYLRHVEKIRNELPIELREIGLSKAKGSASPWKWWTGPHLFLRGLIVGDYKSWGKIQETRRCYNVFRMSYATGRCQR